MAQEIAIKQKKKNGSKMSDEIVNQLKRVNNVLSAKLAVRNSQYRIALEGLKAINEFGDVSVAKKALEAMLDCVPDENS